MKLGERINDKFEGGSQQRKKDSQIGKVETNLPVEVDLSGFVSVMENRLGSMIDDRVSNLEAAFNASISALQKTVIDLTEHRLSKIEAKFTASDRKLREEMRKMKNQFAEQKKTEKNSDPITGQKWRTILGDCARPSGTSGWKLLQFRNRTLKMADGVFGEKYWKSYKSGSEDLRFCGKSAKGKCGRIAFWLGLETMHRLTSRGGNWVVALSYHERGGGPIRCVSYEGFRIDDERAKYKLHLGREVSRHGWKRGFELLENSDGKSFSTKDQGDRVDCAKEYGGGWWFDGGGGGGGGGGGWGFDSCFDLCPNCRIPRE